MSGEQRIKDQHWWHGARLFRLVKKSCLGQSRREKLDRLLLSNTFRTLCTVPVYIMYAKEQVPAPQADLELGANEGSDS